MAVTDPDDTALLSTTDLIDLVLCAAGEQPLLDGLALAGQAGVVHPRGKPLEIDHSVLQLEMFGELRLVRSILPRIQS